jgi:hypothetical protein
MVQFVHAQLPGRWKRSGFSHVGNPLSCWGTSVIIEKYLSANKKIGGGLFAEAGLPQA